MLECPICLKLFKTLSSHVSRIHKIHKEEFYKKYPNSKFYSDKHRKQVSRSCKRSGCGNKKGLVFSEKWKNNISNAMKGTGNPFYGKQHSDETKLRMSENHADFTGDKNPFKKALDLDPNKRLLVSERFKNQWFILKQDPIKYSLRVKQISERTSQQVLDGKIKAYGRGHKHGYINSIKFNLSIRYDSSWEEEFIKWCESKNEITNLTRANLRIHYNNNQNYYIPDFIINNKTIIEIKPEKLIPTNSIKIEAGKEFAKNNGYNYVLISNCGIKAIKSGEAKKLEDLIENFITQ